MSAAASNPNLVGAASISQPMRQAAVRVAKAGGAETALPMLLSICGGGGGDSECKLHLAASLARLGFGVAAMEVLVTVSPSPLREQVARVAATCRTVGVAGTVRLARARAFAEVLAGCAGADVLAAALERATGLIAETELFVGAGGRSLIWARGVSAELMPGVQVRSSLLGLPGDAQAAVQRSADQVFLVGAEWLALAAALAVPKPLPAGWGPGYGRRVHLICRSEREVGEVGEGGAVRAMVNLLLTCGGDESLDSAGAAVVAAGQVMVWGGEDPLAGLVAWLRGHQHLRLAGQIVPISAPVGLGASSAVGGEPAHEEVRSVVQDVLDEQRALVGTLARELGIGAGVCVAGGERSGEGMVACEGRARGQQRILIVSTRYSTFMQHSAADLAAAFVAMGHAAEVLLEEDSFSIFAAPAIMQAQLRLRPDVVVMINYTRSAVMELVPARTPIVTWVQDAMGHLFDERAGRAMGSRDVVAGHLYPELFSKFGFPAGRSVPTPVLVNPTKFAGPHEPALLAKYRCDVAYVSHHSQTPEQLCAKLMADAGDAAGGRVAEAIGLLFAGVWMAVGACDRELFSDSLPNWVNFALRRHNLAEEPGLAERMLATVAWPLAERLMRHRMLGWAVEICKRRNWSLRLYGKGWERHHDWGNLAAGPLGHGPELAAAYGAAAVHLHASVGSFMHQRVMECAVAGGVPLVFRKADDVMALEQQTNRMLVGDDVPASMCELWPHRGREWVAAADHAASLRFVAQCQRLGVPHNHHFPGMFHLRRAWGSGPAWQAGAACTQDGAWMLGDLAETTFGSEAELEVRLERLIGSAERRREISGGIKDRVCRTLSYEALVPRLLRLMRPADVPVA